MKKDKSKVIFKKKYVRRHWDEYKELWYFSIIDVVSILTQSVNPRKYWSVLKARLKKEGSQLATKCSQLKMRSSDGKFYYTDVADTETLLRLIQSIPSPKAEPFKLWLAKVEIYNIKGQKIKELLLNNLTSEKYNSIIWNADDQASWIYLCKHVNDEKVLNFKKITLLK